MSANGTITHVTDESFGADVEQGKGLVLVDFWAEWCGPCKQLTPLLEKAVRAAKGKVKLVKMNIDDNPMTPNNYAVRGIPTLILFKNGTVEAQKVGAVSKSQLSAFLDSNL